MGAKLFTLDDIVEFLDSMGLNWSDTLVYIPEDLKYRRAVLQDFNGKTNYMYIQNMNNKVYYKVRAKICNDKFILSRDSTKIDLSDDWQQDLHQKQQNIQVKV